VSTAGQICTEVPSRVSGLKLRVGLDGAFAVRRKGVSEQDVCSRTLMEWVGRKAGLVGWYRGIVPFAPKLGERLFILGRRGRNVLE